MLGNRAIKITLDKDKKPDETTTKVTVIDIKQVSEAITNMASVLAVTGGFIYAGKKVIDTASTIAVIAAESKFRPPYTY
jgi:hypothetical protein